MARHSDLAQHRAERVDRPSKRRTGIVDAAEALFLERGIAATSMTDIAERVGVTRVTIYRYFSSVDEVAFEVALRMLDKLVADAREVVPPGAGTLEAVRAGLASMITNFERNRDVHWYLTVLDSYRPFHDIDAEFAASYRERMRQTFSFHEAVSSEFVDDATRERFVTLTNVVMGVLGRYAIQDVNLSVAWMAQLGHLNELVLDYFDTVIVPKAKPPAT